MSDDEKDNGLPSEEAMEAIAEEAASSAAKEHYERQMQNKFMYEQTSVAAICVNNFSMMMAGGDFIRIVFSDNVLEGKSAYPRTSVMISKQLALALHKYLGTFVEKMDEIKAQNEKMN